MAKRRAVKTTQTVSDGVSKAADDLLADLGVLLLNHSNLQYENAHQGELVFIGSGDYHFVRIQSLDGIRLQSKLRDSARVLVQWLRILLLQRSVSARETIDELEKKLRDAIEQEYYVFQSSTAAVLKDCRESVNGVVRTFETLHDPAEGKTLLVPDTNALLYSHVLSDWRYADLKRFTVVLMPTVLSELDLMKVNRSEDVREKAESLIRQLKELRRRGTLNDGVTIVKGTSSLRSVAAEPRMDESLPWLTVESMDDRLLASTIELMRAHPRAAVLLVTRDINLQNKADLARVPYLEPPEPIKPVSVRPSVEQDVARLRRERMAVADREQALREHGPEWADEEVDALFARLVDIAAASNLELRAERGERQYLRLTCHACVLLVQWSRLYGNTLEYTALTVKMARFSREPPTSGGLYPLGGERTFAFGLTVAGRVWRDKRSGQEFLTNPLADELVGMLIEAEQKEMTAESRRNS